MNCYDFDAIAGDLAEGRLMDAAQRENALAHSTSCASCASRLTQEEALTGGLRLLAKTSNEEAPARIENALLAAFRQQRVAVPVVAPSRTSMRRRSSLWLYAAASVAAIALIVTLLALVVTRNSTSQQASPQKAANPDPAVPNEHYAPTLQPQALPSTGREVAVQAPQGRRRSSERLGRVDRSKPQANDLDGQAGAEIATEFIPLMNREALAQMDGGQIMRVELPRSALMSFGLPMDMERANERIKADVVVGNDGLARAIRFVR